MFTPLVANVDGFALVAPPKYFFSRLPGMASLSASAAATPVGGWVEITSKAAAQTAAAYAGVISS